MRRPPGRGMLVFAEYAFVRVARLLSQALGVCPLSVVCIVHDSLSFFFFFSGYDDRVLGWFTRGPVYVCLLDVEC